MQSPLLPRYLVLPRSKYSPQHHVLKHPQLPFLPQCQRAIPLLPLWAVRPVQSLSACTRMHFTFTFTFYQSPELQQALSAAILNLLHFVLGISPYFEMRIFAFSSLCTAPACDLHNFDTLTDTVVGKSNSSGRP